jgi:hypothetical protein
MGNAVHETNEMILDMEEKNQAIIDGSSVLCHQDTVTEREKSEDEIADEMRREMDKIRREIREYQIVEHGRVLTQEEWMAPFKQWEEESKKETDRLLVKTVAKILPPVTPENIEDLREYYGEDFMDMVEEYLKTADGN